MELLAKDAAFILEAEKRLRGRCRWTVAKSSRDGCARRVNFEARVSIGGTMPRGIWFRITVIPQYADTATFQLECDTPGFRAHLPLYRLDWNPAQTHLNGQHGPAELRGMFIDAGITHAHNCLDHIDDSTGLLRNGGVQTARIIKPDFSSYDEALLWVCDKLRIRNRGDIPPPPAQAEMF